MKKVAIVTGGSSGIGLAIVEQLLGLNYQVCNLDIAESDCGHYYPCDMSDTSQVKETIAAIVSQYQQVDALVCNAGIHISANIEETDEATLDRVIGINVKGAYAATQAVLPVMKGQSKGAIVYVSSEQALVAKRRSFAYNLSKTALLSMAKTTALDYAQFGIRANAVCPGTIETPLFHQAIDRYCQGSGVDKSLVVSEEAAMQPLGRLGQPEEVAKLVTFLLSDDALFITGSAQVIDGGYTTQ